MPLVKENGKFHFYADINIYGSPGSEINWKTPLDIMLLSIIFILL